MRTWEMTNVLDLGLWAEILDDRGNVLALGKIWPNSKQRLAVIREGIVNRTRLTALDGQVFTPGTNTMFVHENIEYYVRWSRPEIMSTPPSLPSTGATP